MHESVQGNAPDGYNTEQFEMIQNDGIINIDIIVLFFLQELFFRFMLNNRNFWIKIILNLFLKTRGISLVKRCRCKR